jgi:hypothetical protein
MISRCGGFQPGRTGVEGLASDSPPALGNAVMFECSGLPTLKSQKHSVRRLAQRAR